MFPGQLNKIQGRRLNNDSDDIPKKLEAEAQEKKQMRPKETTGEAQTQEGTSVRDS